MNEVMAGMREAPPTSSTLLRGARAFGRMSGCICMAKCMENIHGKRCATAVCSQFLLSSLGLALCSRFVSDCRRLVALLDCTVLPFYVLRCTVLLRRSAKLKSNSSSKTKKRATNDCCTLFPMHISDFQYRQESAHTCYLGCGRNTAFLLTSLNSWNR